MQAPNSHASSKRPHRRLDRRRRPSHVRQLGGLFQSKHQWDARSGQRPNRCSPNDKAPSALGALSASSAPVVPPRTLRCSPTTASFTLERQAFLADGSLRVLPGVPGSVQANIRGTFPVTSALSTIRRQQPSVESFFVSSGVSRHAGWPEVGTPTPQLGGGGERCAQPGQKRGRTGPDLFTTCLRACG